MQFHDGFKDMTFIRYITCFHCIYTYISHEYHGVRCIVGFLSVPSYILLENVFVRSMNYQFVSRPFEM